MVSAYLPACWRGRRARCGEAAYQRSKQRQALAWIASHKRRFLLLTAERFRLFWLPNMRRSWQSVFEAALTLLGLCGLAFLFWKGYAFAWVAIAALVAYPAVYDVIQVSPRYRLPLEPILLLRAASLFFGIFRSHARITSLTAWATWRRHSRLPGPDSSGRLPGVLRSASRSSSAECSWRARP